MARYRRHSMASALALAMGLLSLTACGGGGGLGGGGGGIISTPPPPPPPGAIIGAAAQAAIPNASLLPQASAGGPTMQTHPVTAFPLVQTVVTLEPLALSANTAAIGGGATLTFDADAGEFDNFSLRVPGAGVANVFLELSGYYSDCLCASVGTKSVSLGGLSTGDLNWTAYGTWSVRENETTAIGTFVTGYQTPVGSIPLSGSATYNGTVEGRVFYPDPNSSLKIGSNWLSGDASLQANFATLSISGNLTNMMVGSNPWNSVSLMGAISGGNFSGTTAATSAPAGALSGSATGSFAGMFFGPGAEELGAVWTLHDGTSTAVGTIGAKTGP